MSKRTEAVNECLEPLTELVHVKSSKGLSDLGYHLLFSEQKSTCSRLKDLCYLAFYQISCQQHLFDLFSR